MSKYSDEKYTPSHEIAKVKNAFGGYINLDPCWHCDSAVNPGVGITKEQDCLKTDWTRYFFPNHTSTVFMNPPYSNSTPFIKKLTDTLDSNYDIMAITLTLAGIVSNKGTQSLLKKYAVGGCSPTGRINFINGGKSNDRDVVYTLWGNPIYYDRFALAFKDGLCYKY